MKVLYVNHTGQVSGAERSLLEVVRHIRHSVTPLVACPPGPLADMVADAGVLHVAIPGTDGSLRLHPRHTPEAVAAIARGAMAVRSASRRYEISVVHANSIRGGLFATLAQGRQAPPTIVHLRDRLPSSPVTTLTLRALSRADLLIANSNYTAASLDEAGVSGARQVIGNPVDLLRFDPERIDRNAVRSALGLEPGDFVTAVLAQITPWKGQEEAIRALAHVRARHPHAKLLLVGAAKFVAKATRYDNQTYLAGLHRLVSELGLEDDVEFLGEREDVPEVLGALDALLVPSWEEPFGRSVIEAMAMGVPVIATSVGGPAEVITDGRDGMLLGPQALGAWAEAICELIESPELCERLAHHGRRRAQDFSADAHAEALLSAYDGVLARVERRGEAVRT